MGSCVAGIISAMRIAVISDTHMPRKGLALPAACAERLRAADLIVHAGDWSSMDALALVRGLGPPVVGVRGNVEEPAVRAALPATAEAEVEGVRIGVVHDGGPGDGRPPRLRRRFPAADAVVFGHSHIPWHEVGADGLVVLNPGSPTDRRRSPRHSMAEIEVDGGRIAAVIFWAVDEPPGPLAAELVRGGPR
jgi:putative phosphoesterase